jgi:hypothetical protein
MSNSTLLTLWDEVRGKTLRLLDGATEPESLWSPPGLHNSIRGHAGHCYAVVESLCAKALQTTPRCSKGWFELFGWNSRPELTKSDEWPPLEDVIARLGQQHERLRGVFASLTPETLSSHPPHMVGASVRR